jgi:hypothetical protein
MDTVPKTKIDLSKITGPYPLLGLFLLVVEGLLGFWLFRANSMIERIVVGSFITLIFGGFLFVLVRISTKMEAKSKSPGIWIMLSLLLISGIYILNKEVGLDGSPNIVGNLPLGKPSSLTPQSPTSVQSTPASPQTFAPQPLLPANTCPDVQGRFWIQFPNTWYGPFAGGDGISFSNAGGFYVWDADMLNVFGGYGAVIPYPDPFLQIPRNVWIPLQQSRFSVCVDNSGNVFGLQRLGQYRGFTRGYLDPSLYTNNPIVF